MLSKRAARITSVADARRRARRSLPRALRDYVEGGADDELTVGTNERAFQALELLPRMGVEVGEPSLATTVLGLRLELPILLAPCGFIQIVHPDGAVGVARAAGAAGTVAVLSRSALCAPEEVASCSAGPHWFHVNAIGGLKEVRSLIDRAAKAGFAGLVVNLDGPPPGNLERNLHNGVAPPVRVTPRLLARLGAQLLSRPRWAVGMLPAGAHALGSRISAFQGASRTLRSGDLHDWPRFSWADVEWMRGLWPGHLVVKGVLTAADAGAARDAGADAVLISNHGGRQLDGVPAPISVLPEVVDAVGGSIEVLLDGGIRRGTDVVKALALGARAVLIGRPYVYGLATAGQPGVERILEVFGTEISRALKQMGCGGVGELGPSWLRPRPIASGALPLGSGGGHLF